MKKIAFLLILIALLGCEEDDYKQSIVIKTDKSSYSIGENIKLEIYHNFDSDIKYFDFPSPYLALPQFWKLENNSWSEYYIEIYTGYPYCCEVLKPNTKYEDIFGYEFEKGIYKIEYSFSIEDEGDFKSYYSNEFTVK